MSDWPMFHRDPSHSGEETDSDISAHNVWELTLLHSLEVAGSILSTPAIVDGFVYVGLANTHAVATQNGGQMLKVDLASGEIVHTFTWPIGEDERDSHGFCGMGSTPAVVDERVYFSAFDGKLYCLSAEDLTQQWVVDLRNADPSHNQPVTNDVDNFPPYPQAAGWSSPVVSGDRVYVGMGEGENPELYGFVYCLDAKSGDVVWIFCTCKYEAGRDNRVNELPAEMIKGELPKGFTTFDGQPLAKGASIWASIAHDPQLDHLYCATGNPQPDGALPTAGYTNAVVVLKASTGEFLSSIQIPASSSYRPSDVDVDIGGSPTLFEISGNKYVGIGCKNGAYVVFQPAGPPPWPITAVRQLLPLHRDGSQISTVDPHGPDDPSMPYPAMSNDSSNAIPAENFSGTYSTAAVCSSLGKLFIGIGGNNYHYISPGIDSSTTPFIRALDWFSLADAWPLDDGDPQRYAIAAEQESNPLYKMAGESGISVPAVANDVVFMATTRVALYAFSAVDGTLLWADTDHFGPQTGGTSGGYGYCMGPAIAGNYVVAGALVSGGSGGVLNIYTLPSAATA